MRYFWKQCKVPQSSVPAVCSGECTTEREESWPKLWPTVIRQNFSRFVLASSDSQLQPGRCNSPHKGRALLGFSPGCCNSQHSDYAVAQHTFGQGWVPRKKLLKLPQFASWLAENQLGLHAALMWRQDVMGGGWLPHCRVTGTTQADVRT